MAALERSSREAIVPDLARAVASSERCDFTFLTY
jgi:hypothetical protein